MEENTQEKLNQNKLDRLLEISEENHKMLKSLHRIYIIGFIYKVIYIVVVIGILIFAYHSLKPVYTNVKANYQGIFNNLGSILGTYSNIRN